MLDARKATRLLLMDQVLGPDCPRSADSTPEFVRLACPLCADLGAWIFGTPSEGEWFHCPACHFAGDAVELGLRLFRLADAPGLVAHLQQTGRLGRHEVPDATAVARYQAQQLTPRRRTAEFWAARTSDMPLLEPWSLSRLQIFTMPPDRPAREPVPRQVVGYASRHQVEDFFQPGSYAPGQRANRGGRSSVRRGSGAGHSRIFTDPTWENVHIVPFEDAPGRICGFWMARDPAPAPIYIPGTFGRFGVPSCRRPPLPEVIFRAAPGPGARLWVRESGVALLDNAFQGFHGRLEDNPLFIFTDVDLAIQLHLRWLRQYYGPLPLVAAFEEGRYRSRAVWRNIPNKKRIVWAPQLGWRELLLARFADARISTVRMPVDVMLYSHRTPLDTLCLLRSQLVTWQQAMYCFFRADSLQEVEQSIRAAKFTPPEWIEFLKKMPADVRSRIQPVLAKPDFLPAVRCPRGTVAEHPDGWYVRGTGSEVCNGQIRITEQLNSRFRGSFHRGHVRLGEQQIPFLISCQEARRRGFLQVLAEYLQQAGVSGFRYSKRWNQHGAYIATMLEPSQVVENADYVGWSHSRLQFPAFALSLGGDVQLGAILAGSQAPCRHFQLPQTLRRLDVRMLTRRSRESRLFWALFATLAHHVSSSMDSPRPLGIGLVGQGAQVVCRQAARLLGCQELLLQPNQRLGSWVAKIRQACQEHLWPVFVQPAANAVNAESALIRCLDFPNCIMPLADADARLAQNRGWILIRSEPYFDTLAAIENLAPQALVSYLADLCDRSGKIGSPTSSRLHNQLIDIADWLAAQGGDGEAVVRAAHVLQAPAFPSVRLPFDGTLRRHAVAARRGYLYPASFIPRHQRQNRVSCETGSLVAG